MGKFLVSCEHCNHNAEYSFEYIGLYGECNQCGTLIEFSPPLDSSAKKSNNFSSVHIIVVLSTFVLSGVLSYFFTKTEEPSDLLSRKTKDVKTKITTNQNSEPFESQGIKNSIPENDIKPKGQKDSLSSSQEKIEYEVISEGFDKDQLKEIFKKYLNHDRPYKINLLIEKNLLLTKNSLNSNGQLQVRVPTKYGERVTIGMLVEDFKTFQLVEVDSGPMDIEPIKLSQKIPNKLSRVYRKKSKDGNSDKIMIETLDTKTNHQTILNGNYYFNARNELVIVDLKSFWKDRKIRIFPGLFKKIEEFKINNKTKIYEDEFNFVNANNANVSSDNILFYDAYKYSEGEYSKQVKVFPIAEDIFISFYQNDLDLETLFIDKKHIIKKINGDYGESKSNVFPIYTIYKSINFKSSKFYKIDKKPTIYNSMQLHCFSPKEKSVKSAVYKVKYLINEQNKLSFKLDGFSRDTREKKYYVGVSGDTLISHYNGNGRGEVKYLLNGFVKDSDIGTDYDNINAFTYQGDRQSTIISSFGKLTIISNKNSKNTFIYDWEAKAKIYLPEFEDLNLLKALKVKGSYYVYAFSTELKSIVLLDCSSKKVLKRLALEVCGDVLFSNDGELAMLYDKQFKKTSIIDFRKFKIKSFEFQNLLDFRWDEKENGFKVLTGKQNAVTSLVLNLNGITDETIISQRDLSVLRSYHKSPNHYSLDSSLKYFRLPFTSVSHMKLCRDDRTYILFDKFYDRAMFALHGMGDFNFRDFFIDGDHVVFLTESSLLSLPKNKLLNLYK